MRITDKIILTLSLIVFSVSTVTGGPDKETDIPKLWADCSLTGVVSFAVFNTAMLGYLRIENIKKKNLLTVIDYSKPSTQKRFFVIDLKNKKLLYYCFVAHGKNSGENYPKAFSNQKQSLKSCLGFFLTAGTYSGKNGYSLQLDGLEKNINDNTRNREIVIHGAEYVSTEYIKNYGRLGRSWGCPVLPPEISKEVIDIISGGSCLFIYADDPYYKENSGFKIKKT
jgi:L,D-transpeptidase catalytic domain